MTSPAIAPDMNVPPQPSPIERVINVFIAPTKAFVGLQRKASSWWLPFLLIVIVSYAYVGVLDQKVGFDKISQNQIKQNQKAVDRLEKLTPEQRQQQYDLSAKITKYISYTSPVLALIIFAVIAGVLLATFNFGFGASIKFSTMFAVAVFAHLPNLLKAILTVVALMAGSDPDSFDIRNPIATNLGSVVGHGSGALYALASSIDIFSIWICVLMGIGIASVSKIKRGTALGVVFGWYVLISLVGVGWVAAFGG
jgi:Yip1 domain